MKLAGVAHRAALSTAMPAVPNEGRTGRACAPSWCRASRGPMPGDCESPRNRPSLRALRCVFGGLGLVFCLLGTRRLVFRARAFLRENLYCVVSQGVCRRRRCREWQAVLVYGGLSGQRTGLLNQPITTQRWECWRKGRDYYRPGVPGSLACQRGAQGAWGLRK